MLTSTTSAMPAADWTVHREKNRGSHRHDFSGSGGQVHLDRGYGREIEPRDRTGGCDGYKHGPAPCPIPVVLVTETEFRRARLHFARPATISSASPCPATEDALCDAIAQHGTPARDRRVVSRTAAGSIRRCGRGGVIARFGVGYDNVDRRQATEAGLLCTNTPDVLQQSVAELTMMMIGAAARHLVAGGDWRARRRAGSRRQGVELEGKTLALVGCGAIARGRRAHRRGRFRHARDRLRPHRRGRAPSPHFAAMTTDFAEAVGDADFVSLHIPGQSRERAVHRTPSGWR